jgi:hypothetical protein
MTNYFWLGIDFNFLKYFFQGYPWAIFALNVSKIYCFLINNSFFLSDWRQDLFTHSNTLCFAGVGNCQKIIIIIIIIMHSIDFPGSHSMRANLHDAMLLLICGLLHAYFEDPIWSIKALWTNSSNCVALFMIGKLMTHDDVFLSLQAPLQSWWWFVWSKLRFHILGELLNKNPKCLSLFGGQFIVQLVRLWKF